MAVLAPLTESFAVTTMCSLGDADGGAAIARLTSLNSPKTHQQGERQIFGF